MQILLLAVLKLLLNLGNKFVEAASSVIECSTIGKVVLKILVGVSVLIIINSALLIHS